MNIIAVLIIIGAVLLLGIIGLGLVAFVPWRDIIIRRFGHNHKIGLAHILVGDTWIYRQSFLYHEGQRAMSYSREAIIDGEPVTVEDIVPNAIGFDYDEFTGYRVYRVQPGGTVASSDRGDAPKVDYPARLISAHVADRTASKYAASVNTEPAFSWKPIIVGAVVLIVAAALLGWVIFGTGLVKLPGTAPAEPPPAATQPAPPGDTGPVEEVE